jgi:hypothetical protein
MFEFVEGDLKLFVECLMTCDLCFIIKTQEYHVSLIHFHYQILSINLHIMSLSLFPSFIQMYF